MLQSFITECDASSEILTCLIFTGDRPIFAKSNEAQALYQAFLNIQTLAELIGREFGLEEPPPGDRHLMSATFKGTNDGYFFRHLFSVTGSQLREIDVDAWEDDDVNVDVFGVFRFGVRTNDFERHVESLCKKSKTITGPQTPQPVAAPSAQQPVQPAPPQATTLVWRPVKAKGPYRGSGSK